MFIVYPYFAKHFLLSHSSQHCVVGACIIVKMSKWSSKWLGNMLKVGGKISMRTHSCLLKSMFIIPGLCDQAPLASTLSVEPAWRFFLSYLCSSPLAGYTLARSQKNKKQKQKQDLLYSCNNQVRGISGRIVKKVNGIESRNQPIRVWSTDFY